MNEHRQWKPKPKASEWELTAKRLAKEIEDLKLVLLSASTAPTVPAATSPVVPATLGDGRSIPDLLARWQARKGLSNRPPPPQGVREIEVRVVGDDRHPALKIARHFRLKHYVGPIHAIYVWMHGYPGDMLGVSIKLKVPHREPPHLECEVEVDRSEYLPPNPTPEFIFSLLHSLVETATLHEMNESCYTAGVRRWDPHRLPTTRSIS